jgi:hypothetical protein
MKEYTNNTQKTDPPGLVLSSPSEQVILDVNDHNANRLRISENSEMNHGNDLISSDDSIKVQPPLTVTQKTLSNNLEDEPLDDDTGTPTTNSVIHPPSSVEDVGNENDNDNANELNSSVPTSSLSQQQNDEARNSFRSTSTETSSHSSSAPTTVSMNTKPKIAGAYRVTKIRPPGTTTYKVLVPQHVQPGTDFTVEIPEPQVSDSGETTNQNRRVQVTCPTEDVIPGVTDIEILVPAAASYRYYPLKAAQLTIAPTTSPAVAGKAFAMLPSIDRINQQAMNIGGTIRTQVVTIPHAAVPGKKFTYYINGHTNSSGSGTDKQKRGKLKIECPLNCKPGDRLRIVLPAEIPEEEPMYQTFMVVVPDGALAGGHFAVEIGLANQQVLVECPRNSKPGDTLSIQLPTSTVVDKFQALTYPSTGTGWKRTVRISDLHFQWVRLEESIVRAPKRNLPTIVNAATTLCTPPNTMVDPNDNEFVDWTYYHEKAYVRKLVQLEGNDPRLRTASLTLVSAETSSAPSRLKTSNGILLFSYADIAQQQGQPLNGKHLWFLDVCKRLSEYASTTTVDTTNNALIISPDSTIEQSIRILVRREHLLTDSLRAILSLSAEDMRRPWEIEFVGESGIDQGGLTKEWLQCVTEQIFHPSTGLFLPSLNNQAAVDINPVSGKCNMEFPTYLILLISDLVHFVIALLFFYSKTIQPSLVLITIYYIIDSWDAFLVVHYLADSVSMDIS